VKGSLKECVKAWLRGSLEDKMTAGVGTGEWEYMDGIMDGYKSIVTL